MQNHKKHTKSSIRHFSNFSIFCQIVIMFDAMMCLMYYLPNIREHPMLKVHFIWSINIYLSLVFISCNRAESKLLRLHQVVDYIIFCFCFFPNSTNKNRKANVIKMRIKIICDPQCSLVDYCLYLSFIAHYYSRFGSMQLSSHGPAQADNRNRINVSIHQPFSNNSRFEDQLKRFYNVQQQRSTMSMNDNPEENRQNRMARYNETDDSLNFQTILSKCRESDFETLRRINELRTDVSIHIPSMRKCETFDITCELWRRILFALSFSVTRWMLTRLPLRIHYFCIALP